MEKITFVTDDGGKEEFYVEEQTRINGVNYIMVEDDTEFDAVSGVFASMLDDEADITY